MSDTNNNPIDNIANSGKEYINMKIDEYKLRGVEHLSVLSNKLIILLIATMLGGVILQLSGFALAFFIGQLLGSTALGFVIVALSFAIALIIIYIKRNTLFTNKLVKLFIKIFFNDTI